MPAPLKSVSPMQAERKALWSEDALISIAFPSASDVAEVHHE
jgi:hypothetical protein